MPNLIARSQVTIVRQNDPYTILSSLKEFVFTSEPDGSISRAVSFSCGIQVFQGKQEIRLFKIGKVAVPPGFSSIETDEATKTIFFHVAANTKDLADNGTLTIPVEVSRNEHRLNISWSKSRQGHTGADANLLDWVKEWNNNKTSLDGNQVITPKLFSGIKNNNGTITGTAIGHYDLSVMHEDGTTGQETINGIYGFCSGKKTFSIKNDGNVEIGHGGESIRFNAATGKIVFGEGVLLNWIGSTYITRDGVFTGLLSAETIKGISISATQITTGLLKASRIDVNQLKTILLTAENIDALTLKVEKGHIGGWQIEADSMYIGESKTNTPNQYTLQTNGITIGTEGIRSFAWRLEKDGQGALAKGNISWDASGNVTFADSVQLYWTNPIHEIKNALGGTSFPKLTHISSSGIYTGTLTSEQVNAIKINADSILTGTLNVARIAAGSIDATKLNVESIRTNIINTGYINGLSLSFQKGSIGGWIINQHSISNGNVTLDSANRRISIYPTGSSSTSGQRVQLYYSDDNDFGFLAIDQYGNKIVQTGSVNSIAGWTFDANKIQKNNVCLGADGSIANSSKWQLNNDGSGKIACGNIGWDAAGVVRFSSAVSLNWMNAIDASKKANHGYPYYKSIIIYGESGKYYPVIIKGGDQNFKRDILVKRAYSEQAPSDWAGSNTHMGGLSLLIKTNFGGWGGISYSWEIYELAELYTRMFAGACHCGNCCMFSIFLRGGGSGGAVYHIYSNQPLETSEYSPSPIPPSPQIAYNEDLIFRLDNYLSYAPTPRALTTAVKDEIKAKSFIPLAQEIINHPLTLINSSGVYTGLVEASQIRANSISAGQINVASLQAVLVTANAVNGLTCTFNKGTIGGWQIQSSEISKNNVHLGGDGSLYHSSRWRFNNDGSGVLASGNLSWDALGNITFSPKVALNWIEAANLMSKIAGAKMMYRDPTFLIGNNGINIYNNVNNGSVSITRIAAAPDNPTGSAYQLKIVSVGIGNQSPNRGGFFFGHATHIYAEYICKFIAWLPSNSNMEFNTNSLGDGGYAKWLTSTQGTGMWAEYACYVRIGSRNNATTNFYSLVNTTAQTITWYLCYATVFECNKTESYLTHIDANGIYTGRLSSHQLAVESAIVVGGNQYNGSISVQDANGAVGVTLSRSGLSAVKGQIGGWVISSTSITAASVRLESNGLISCNNNSIVAWAMKPDGSAVFSKGNIGFNMDGSGFLANRNIYWDTSGNVSVKGIITALGGDLAGFSIDGESLINKTPDSSIRFNLNDSFLVLNTQNYLINMQAKGGRLGIGIGVSPNSYGGLGIVAEAGAPFAIRSIGSHIFGQRDGDTWNAPGLLYIGHQPRGMSHTKIWGSTMRITKITGSQNNTMNYYHNLGHSQYSVLAISTDPTNPGYILLAAKTDQYFSLQADKTYKLYDFFVFGRNIL